MVVPPTSLSFFNIYIYISIEIGDGQRTPLSRGVVGATPYNTMLKLSLFLNVQTVQLCKLGSPTLEWGCRET